MDYNLLIMKLYPYQQKIFDEAVLKFKETNRMMIVIPTGGGKTVVFCSLCKKFGVKSLIVAHTKELISQCENTLRKMNIKNADVMTIQKLHYYQYSVDDYEFLIIDECHRSASPSYVKLIEKFHQKKLLGVTATPFRSDGKWLFDLFGEKISPLSLVDMIKDGLLSDFEGYRVKTNVSLKGVNTKEGDFLSSRLSSAINVRNRNEIIVNEYKKISPGEKALCFAASILHSQEIAKEFTRQGIPCASVNGELTKKQRSEYIQSFKNGDLKVLVSCQILTEGFDEPSITCLLMARPTLSKVLYMQMIGRGSRLYPGKNVCKVIEFTDNDYDVTSLEELISSAIKKTNILHGERISDYENRVKPLLDEAEKTFTEKYSVTRPNITQKLASEWQRKFLSQLGIKCHAKLTEFDANILIKEKVNGK